MENKTSIQDIYNSFKQSEPIETEIAKLRTELATTKRLYCESVEALSKEIEALKKQIPTEAEVIE